MDLAAIPATLAVVGMTDAAAVLNACPPRGSWTVRRKRVGSHKGCKRPKWLERIVTAAPAFGEEAADLLLERYEG